MKNNAIIFTLTLLFSFKIYTAFGIEAKYTSQATFGFIENKGQIIDQNNERNPNC